MLLSFTFENYHSFDSETEFTMSVGRSKKHPRHIANVQEVPILKYATIYGANAAGKTSLISAFRTSRNLICGMPLNQVKQGYCRCDDRNRDKPTSFEYMFENRGRFFQFGFSAILSKEEYISEWLYELDPKFTNETLIYKTELGENGYEYDFDYFNDTSKQRLKIYAEDVKDKHDMLFIRELKDKNIKEDSDLSIFSVVSEWFSKKLRINRVKSIFNDEAVSKAIAHLSRYGTDISSAQFIPSDTDFISELPKDFVDKIKEDPNSIRFGPGVKIVKEGDELKVYRLSVSHNSSKSAFDLEEESAGTREAYEIVSTIFDSEYSDTTYIFDEFGSTMHPLLVKHMIQEFMEETKDTNDQLIIATHHTSIMTLDLYRRDEFWFVDKDKGRSELYSLEQYEKNIRFDSVLSKGYLEGRYGALPVFDQIPDAEQE